MRETVIFHAKPFPRVEYGIVTAFGSFTSAGGQLFGS